MIWLKVLVNEIIKIFEVLVVLGKDIYDVEVKVEFLVWEFNYNV